MCQPPSRLYSMDTVEVVSKDLVVLNEKGLHARPATLIAKAVSTFDAEVTLERDGQCVDAKSVISILILAAARGTTITARATGPDQQAALDAIEILFTTRFQEET